MMSSRVILSLFRAESAQADVEWSRSGLMSIKAALADVEQNRFGPMSTEVGHKNCLNIGINKLL